MTRNRDLPLRTKFVFNLIGLVAVYAATQLVGITAEWYWWVIFASADVFVLVGALVYHGPVKLLLDLADIEAAVRA